MMFELLFLAELLFWVGAMYLSVFEWIKVRDIKSNDKNDFFIPAGFLAIVFVGSLLFFVGFPTS